MSCFWDAILTGLQHLGFRDELKALNPTRRPVTHARALISLLQHLNRRTTSVVWNGTILQDREHTAHSAHVRDFEADTRTYDRRLDGYQCSACDPFLFLVAEIFRINVEHTIGGVDGKTAKMVYSVGEPRGVLRMTSSSSTRDSGHMSFGGTERYDDGKKDRRK